MKDILAIDIHSHLNNGSKFDFAESEIARAHIDKIMRMNELTGIEKTFATTFSAVYTNEEIPQENEYMHKQIKEHDFLYQWVVVEPTIEETFLQAEKMLKDKKCVGIKLHPYDHKYSLEEYADKLFGFASDFNAKVLIHPEKLPVHIAPIADRFPNVSFIVAHLGGKEYVDAVEYAKNQNVYVDTSGSASIRNDIIEYAVSRIGSKKILFGTDTYAAGFHRGRIEYADIKEDDKLNILRYNAERLFADIF